MFCAREKRSVALTARSMVSRRRTSLMPISSSTAMALSPSSSSLDRPIINDWNAAAGSLSHNALNCCPVIPATLPKSSSASPPVAEATSILMSAFEKAEPPICASMPTEDSAAAKPSTCASVRPTCLPAPAMRCAISMMGFSVVAKLLPRSTSVEPMLENWLWLVPMMLANCAMVVAASSALRSSQELPRSIMTRVKSERCSVATPS